MPQDYVSSLLYTHSTESMSCKRQATSQSKPQIMLTCMRSNIKVGGVGFRGFEREREGGGGRGIYCKIFGSAFGVLEFYINKIHKI